MQLEVFIRKLVDYVLLNAYSVNSTGLYNGKAGISLTLFEVARLLNDDYLEDQAYELLQESLLSTNEDLSFENGLAGIGYTLLYLSENGFIDADFDDLFKEQYEKIMNGFEMLREQPKLLLNSIQMIYFLTSIKRVKADDERIDFSIRTLFQAVELYLATQFYDFADIRYINNKSKVLNIFETYLEIVSRCKYRRFSRVILDDYEKLYQNGRIAGSFKAGYYLKIPDMQHLELIYTPSLSLRERIWLTEHSDNDLIKPLIASQEMKLLEQKILKTIPDKVFYAGIEQGLSRLLLYLVRTGKNNNMNANIPLFI